MRIDAHDPRLEKIKARVANALDSFGQTYVGQELKRGWEALVVDPATQLKVAVQEEVKKDMEPAPDVRRKWLSGEGLRHADLREQIKEFRTYGTPIDPLRSKTS